MASCPGKSLRARGLKGALAIRGLKTSVRRWQNCDSERSCGFLKVTPRNKKGTFILGKGEGLHSRKMRRIHAPPGSMCPCVLALEKAVQDFLPASVARGGFE